MTKKQNTTPSINPCALATACIPWSEDGGFREPVFCREIRLLRERGYENLYIFGTAGEGYAVTNTQFRDIAAVFSEETQGMTGLRQLGVIGLSTPQVRERIEIGLELGFNQFQVSLPCWGTLNDTEVERYFTDILDAYPDASFLHYNTPRGRRVLTGAEYARLSDAHPNLAATKSGSHTIASLLTLCNQAPRLRHFVTELDYAAACLLGLDIGLLVSVSAVNPRRSLDFFTAGQQGDNEQLRRLLAELNAIREKVIALATRAGGHMDGTFDKLYARLLDPAFPLCLLSPYQDAGEEACRQLAQWLHNEMPDWRKREA